MKLETDIVAVIGERLELRSAGENYAAKCPFHRDAEMMFYVSSKHQVWHCFGCHMGGDVDSFIFRLAAIPASSC